MNKQNVHYIYLVQITAGNGTCIYEYIYIYKFILLILIVHREKKVLSSQNLWLRGQRVVVGDSLQQRALSVKDSRAPCSSMHSASWLMYGFDQVTAELYLLLCNFFLFPNARRRREFQSLREKTEGVIFSVTKLFFSIIISLHRTTKE